MSTVVARNTRSLDGVERNCGSIAHFRRRMAESCRHFDHPKTLREAASRFYAAFPGRNRLFPDSESDFKLQLRGVPDEEIVIAWWYAEHAGTRGIIAAGDFVINYSMV